MNNNALIEKIETLVKPIADELNYEVYHIEFVKEKIKLNTRRYAKRQFTFFKHQFDNVNWFKTKDEALNFVLGEENGNRR